jgi:hypothetical protein
MIDERAGPGTEAIDAWRNRRRSPRTEDRQLQYQLSARDDMPFTATPPWVHRQCPPYDRVPIRPQRGPPARALRTQAQSTGGRCCPGDVRSGSHEGTRLWWKLAEAHASHLWPRHLISFRPLTFLRAPRGRVRLIRRQAPAHPARLGHFAEGAGVRVAATRKPTRYMESSLWARLAERKSASAVSQLPPRVTRMMQPGLSQALPSLGAPR